MFFNFEKKKKSPVGHAGLYVDPFHHLLGGHTLVVPGSESAAAGFQWFEIRRKRVSRLPTDSYGCSHDHVLPFKECLDDYVEEQLQCALPWRKARGCSTFVKRTQFPREKL